MDIYSSASNYPLVEGLEDLGFSFSSFAGAASRSGLFQALAADPFPE
jgi:hypothetical protein